MNPRAKRKKRERYVLHADLVAGEVRRSKPPEPAELASAAEILARALDGLYTEIRPSGWRVTADARGHCLTIGVYAPRAEGKRPLAAVVGVARRTRCGAVLWHMLRARAPGEPPRLERPLAPWIASRHDREVPPAAVVSAHRVAWAWLADDIRRNVEPLLERNPR